MDGRRLPKLLVVILYVWNTSGGNPVTTPLLTTLPADQYCIVEGKQYFNGNLYFRYVRFVLSISLHIQC